MNAAEKFSSLIHNCEPGGLNPIIQESYDKIIDWMKTEPHMNGFNTDQSKPKLTDGSPYGIAKQFYHYFQTHNTKSYYSLLYLSDELITRDRLSWLDIPDLYILDIGSGTGAATIALLDLLFGYFKFRKKHGYTVHSKKIFIAAIEPNETACRVLNKFLNNLKLEMDRCKIELNITFINEEFPHPDCIDLIKKKWILNEPKTLLIVSSNVIYWTYSTFKRSIEFLKYLGINSEAELGQVEATAIKELVDFYKFEEALLVDIATRDKIKKQSLPKILFQKVKSFINSLKQSQKESGWWETSQEKTIRFLNSPNTFWGEKKSSRKVNTTEYFQCIRCNKSIQEKYDRINHKLVDRKNLEIAWVRSRQYMLKDDIVDEIEIKLVDACWKSYLERLKNHLIYGKLEIVNVNDCMSFYGPKNELETRPRYLLRINEQIISAGISQSNSEAFKPVDKKCIFGNKLNDGHNEFFYDHWFNQFNKYLRFGLKAFKQNGFHCKLDIKSYYANISQNKLYKTICEEAAIRKKYNDRYLLNRIIFRNLSKNYHKNNHGIPQSGIASGLWSNLYLKNLDREVLSLHSDKVFSYARYADDMTLIASEKNMDDIIGYITKSLETLDLQLNTKKTKKEKVHRYFQRLNNIDSRYEELGRKAQWIMNPLYHLPAQYVNAKNENRDIFLSEYEELLNNLGIYFPDFPYWLSRKIHQRSTHFHNIVFQWKILTGKAIFIHFPKYKLLMDRGEKNTWINDFKLYNFRWISKRDEIVSELTNFFIESYKSYKTCHCKDTKNEFRRAMRFSAYRLGWFGINGIIEYLEEMLSENPWDLSPKIILKAIVDSGYQEKVLSLAKEWRCRNIPKNLSEDCETSGCTECAPTLCAAACRALGYGVADEDIIDFLWGTLLFSDGHLIERLSASEALLRHKICSDIYYDQIIRLAENSFDNPYLIKNLILLMANSNDKDRAESITKIGDNCRHLIVIDAMNFALANEKPIFDVNEPKIITDYYSSWYPDIPFDKPVSS